MNPPLESACGIAFQAMLYSNPYGLEARATSAAESHRQDACATSNLFGPGLVSQNLENALQGNSGPSGTIIQFVAQFVDGLLQEGHFQQQLQFLRLLGQKRTS